MPLLFRRSFSSSPRKFALAFGVGVSTIGLLTGVASADTTPPGTTSPTVSADPLPTVQINGVVWAQVIVGNTVYATGEFSKARPAGAAPGTQEVSRNNLIAYDIRTGVMTSFNHSLNGAGKAITASPDGKYLYVGGKFTEVDGKAHSRIAQFSLPSGDLVAKFKYGTSSTVNALAATNSNVFAGGSFAKASTGSAHSQIVAFSPSTGGIRSWAPQVTGNNGIAAMIISPDQKNVIIGGSFNKINGKTFHSLGAISIATGKPIAWASSASSFPIQSDSPSAGITSLSTDGKQVYLTSYNYKGKTRKGAFEGRAAINATNGKLIWLNDCHGDSYSAVPVGKVLYSVGHAHDCKPAGAFPETSPRSFHHALAETTNATAKNGAASGGYPSFKGKPRGTQLAWYPDFGIGSYTGQSQAGWSIKANSKYVVVGGEFPRVNQTKQQGLVRFAVSSLAPNKVKPLSFTKKPTATKADSKGNSKVTFYTTADPDNAVLTYSVYRDGGTKAIYTVKANTRFWSVKTLSFTDTKLKAGSTHTYKIVAKDGFGNSITTTS